MEKKKWQMRGPRRPCSGPTATDKQMNKYLGSQSTAHKQTSESLSKKKHRRGGLFVSDFQGTSTCEEKARAERNLSCWFQRHFVQNPNSKWRDYHWMAGRRRDKWQNWELANTEKTNRKRLSGTMCVLHAEAITKYTLRRHHNSMPCVATYRQLHLVEQPLQGTV